MRGWGDRQRDPGVGCPHRSILEDGGFPEWVVKAAQQNKRYRNYWRSTRNYVSVKTKAGLRNQVRISMQYGAWTWNNDQGWALEGSPSPVKRKQCKSGHVKEHGNTSGESRTMGAWDGKAGTFAKQKDDLGRCWDIKHRDEDDCDRCETDAENSTSDKYEGSVTTLKGDKYRWTKSVTSRSEGDTNKIQRIIHRCGQLSTI